MAIGTEHSAGIKVEYPAGVDGIFVFNGLTLNDRSSADVYRIYKISGLYDSEIRDSREVNPSRHGETSYASYYSGKQITIEGVIRAGNLAKLRNMIASLQAAFADISQEYPLYFNNTWGTSVYLNCKKVTPIEIEESFSNRRMERNFQITLRASDPLIYSTTETTSYIVPTKGTVIGRVYPRDLNVSYKEIAYNLDGIFVVNNGTFNKYPKLRIYGAFSNPFIMNYTTGQKIVINYSIASGDYIDYDLNNHTLVNSNGVSIISSLDISSDDLYLAPGSNSIGFGDPNPDIGTTTLEIKYRNAYI